MYEYDDVFKCIIILNITRILSVISSEKYEKTPQLTESNYSSQNIHFKIHKDKRSNDNTID